MKEQADLWVMLFGIFCIGILLLVVIVGWLAKRRKERKWKKRYEKVRQEMIKREEREKRDNRIYNGDSAKIS